MAIYTVSDITRRIKGLLSADPALQRLLVRGEISNFKCYASGHCYFTLKDAASSLKCVMFRSRAQALRFAPVNGLSVVAAGNVSVYERDGAYQLYVDSLMPEGVGELSLAFAQLKEKLAKEGVFSEEHKRGLPAFPKTIGIVTSVSGAVLRDIYRVSKRRCPKIRLVLFPVQVQGDGAAAQIAKGIRFFNKKYPVDVIIAGRGGGSMEDLWAFNEEIVVRAIYASRIPLISAVGHETDYTLADFAADVRAATPSQAAELAVPDSRELVRHIEGLAARLSVAMKGQLQARRSRLQACMGQLLQPPQKILAGRRQRLDAAVERLGALGQDALRAKRHALELQMEKLAALNPLNVLRRGYGIVEDARGQAVRSAAGLAVGDRVRVSLADGSFRADVWDVQ